MTRRPLSVLAAGLAGLVIVAIPVTHLSLGLPDAGSEPTSSTERRAYDLLTQGFGPGFNGVLTVVVDAPGLDKDRQALVGKRTTEGLAGLPAVAAVAEPVQNTAGDATIVSVTPKSGPSSEGTKESRLGDPRQGRGGAGARPA